MRRKSLRRLGEENLCEREWNAEEHVAIPRIWEVNESIPHTEKIASLEKHVKNSGCFQSAQIKILSLIYVKLKMACQK